MCGARGRGSQAATATAEASRGGRTAAQRSPHTLSRSLGARGRRAGTTTQQPRAGRGTRCQCRTPCGRRGDAGCASLCGCVMGARRRLGEWLIMPTYTVPRKSTAPPWVCTDRLPGSCYVPANLCRRVRMHRNHNNISHQTPAIRRLYADSGQRGALDNRHAVARPGGNKKVAVAFCNGYFSTVSTHFFARRGRRGNLRRVIPDSL